MIYENALRKRTLNFECKSLKQKSKTKLCKYRRKDNLVKTWFGTRHFKEMHALSRTRKHTLKF